jgi:tRNA A-37 threonylcarbamoyl transferase component Bud32/predicted hydrocarbon binding protein
VHGLIFFYLQKYADVAAAGSTSWKGIRSSTATSTAKYLPSGVYPDADAVAILTAISETTGRPLPAILDEFGRFLAPNLIKVARPVVDPKWRTLDLIENTEQVIHAMIRTSNPGAAPPVLEAVRQAPDEVHLVYSSARKLCPLAVGLMHGLAAHYGEKLAIEETSCMLRGDPFCSFVVQRVGGDTHAEPLGAGDTVAFHPGAANPGGQPAPPAAFVEDTAADTVPRSIGGYPVLGPIGRGAMGRVFLAEDRALGRRVAIKVMHSSRAGDQAARRRFLRESRATAAVEHPHVVTIYHVGEDASLGGLPYIVMQWLRGSTLAAYRAREGRLLLKEIMRIGRQIAEGLAAAHDRGLIHRDIKPDNIFLEGEANSVKIIDFGLARDVSDDRSMAQVTMDGALVGTPAYMAPERIGDKSLDARTDLFGLGVMLFELLAGKSPFTGSSMMAVLASIARGEPLELAEVAPEVPEDVAALVMKLIAHDPANRPADARSVAEALGRLERLHGV